MCLELGETLRHHGAEHISAIATPDEVRLETHYRRQRAARLGGACSKRSQATAELVVWPSGIPASRSVIQDIERCCSTIGGLGIRSTKGIIVA